ncbi:MAG: TlpA disulfide reductase family protein [Alphaproteobacteria bacterium]|nr:TlpA disulfide reductase family protein [Alphaproteobacteria bacterium]
MKIKSFWLGVIIAIVMTILYQTLSVIIHSFQDNEMEEMITLLDINYIPALPTEGVPTFEFNLYPPNARGESDRQSKKLSDFKGKPVILHFWAPWCPPCVSELPEYDNFAKGKKVIDLSVVFDGSLYQKVSAFYEKHSIKNLTTVIDEKGKLARAMKIESTPTTIFIDKNGKEVGRIADAINWKSKAVVNLLLAQML